jgi:hypothetical protein
VRAHDAQVGHLRAEGVLVVVAWRGEVVQPVRALVGEGDEMRSREVQKDGRRELPLLSARASRRKLE